MKTFKIGERSSYKVRNANISEVSKRYILEFDLENSRHNNKTPRRLKLLTEMLYFARKIEEIKLTSIKYLLFRLLETASLGNPQTT